MSKLYSWMNPINATDSNRLTQLKTAAYSKVQTAIDCGVAEKDLIRRLIDDFFKLEERFIAAQELNDSGFLSARSAGNFSSVGSGSPPLDNVGFASLSHEFNNATSTPRLTCSPPESFEFGGFGVANLIEKKLKNHSHHQLLQSTEGRAFPIQFLPEKRSFCGALESQECNRCKVNKLRGSGASSITSSDSKNNISLNFDFENKSCSFCYVHYKKYCQKLYRPWPRIEDPGFWHGHITKDESGNVVCPELFKLMCPLCYATGHEAHTIKFCPLNVMSA